LDEFRLLLDTYESTLEEEKELEKVDKFRKYILNHWGFIKDWRKRIDHSPRDARIGRLVKGLR